MTALIVVDVQNDFLPGGSLAIPEGNLVIPKINHLVQLPFKVRVATKDWHPADHGSFAINQGKLIGEVISLYGIQQILWPVHCVQGTLGSEFAPTLDVSHFDRIFYKGSDPKIDSYSCFFDNGHLHSTGLSEYLREQGIEHLFFAGLATDYCIKYSVLGALALGFSPYVITDACRGVDLHEDDCSQALLEMSEAGAKLITSDDLKSAQVLL